MGMSRRLFGGLLAAAPAAAMADAPTPNPPAYPSVQTAGFGSGINSATEYDWRQETRRELEGLRTRLKSVQEDRDGFEVTNKHNDSTYAHYRSLKSLSEGVRSVLIRRRLAEIERANQIGWLQARIAELAQKLVTG